MACAKAKSGDIMVALGTYKQAKHDKGRNCHSRGRWHQVMGALQARKSGLRPDVASMVEEQDVASMVEGEIFLCKLIF